jgi:hypothetical protein
LKTKMVVEGDAWFKLGVLQEKTGPEPGALSNCERKIPERGCDCRGVCSIRSFAAPSAFHRQHSACRLTRV